MRCLRCFLVTESAHVTRADCIYALRSELVSRNLALALARERIRVLEGGRNGAEEREDADQDSRGSSSARSGASRGDRGAHDQPSADGVG